MEKRSSLVKTAVVLILITTICTLFLAGGNLLYSQVLQERQRALRMDILKTFGAVFAEGSFDGLFAQNVGVVVDKKNKATYYTYKGEPAQGAILISGSGLWGPIEILVFIDLGKNTVKELRILSHSETPGLGARIEEAWFLDQFKDLDFSDSVKIVSLKTGNTGEVDAITGATKTGVSLEAIINRGITLYRQPDKR